MHPTSLEGVFVPWLEDVDACSGCGRCELACTWGAISMTAFVDDARRRLREKRPSCVPTPAKVA
jgi:ferredoxin